MPYTYTDESTTADAGFTAWGKDVAEMCVAACDAVGQLMVMDLSKIREMEVKEMDIAVDNVDNLVRQCVAYILFYKDAEGLILRLRRPAVWTTSTERWRLTGRAVGESIDPERHDLGVDVKAITYQSFSVRSYDQGWQAKMVVDV